MKFPVIDDDGYPTDETLECIKTWPFGEYPSLMQYVTDAWSDYGWFEQTGGHFDPMEDETPWACATGGWSGNESIIGALQDNFAFWMTCWECSARGGYYEFHLKG